MSCRPDLVASSSASLAPVLQHFGDLLSKGSRGRSIKVRFVVVFVGAAAHLDLLSRGSRGRSIKVRLVASWFGRWVALPFFVCLMPGCWLPVHPRGSLPLGRSNSEPPCPR